MPNPAQTTAALMVDKTTGAIVAPVAVSLFRSENSLGAADAVHPHTSITGLTGGGATNLDGQATAAGAEDAGHTVLLTIGGVSQIWQLQAGTDAEDVAAGVVRPDDYNASTNAVIWRRLGHVADLGTAAGADTGDFDAAGSAAAAQAAAVQRSNHTGTQSADTLTDGTTNKAFLATERTKLSGIATGATANSSDATLLARANHTGTQAQSTVTSLVSDLAAKQPLATVLTNTTAAFTTAQETKLAGVATGATANSTDATLLARANHTGEQAISTVTGLQAALDAAGAVSSVDGQTGAVDTGYDDRITALENIEPTASGSNLVSGGGVSLTGGLTLTVSAATYNILGAPKSSVETILTAATADPTNPRYDVVALDDTNTAVLITGTPAATPIPPTVDPATQLYLTFIQIPAGATSITGTETIIYDSNDDYTMTEQGTSVVLNSSNNPFGGSGVCIEATNMAAGDYFRAQTPSGTIDLGTFNVLRFRIRNKAAWHASKQIAITGRLNGVQVGQAVVFKPGLHAFDGTVNFSSYQHISINPNLFANGGQAINQLQWTCAGGGTSIPGFYVDDIVLQAGVSQAVDSTRLRDRGAHSTALQYDVNDLAYSGDIIYKALQQTPVGIAVTNTTYWAVFGMRNPMTTAGDSIVGGTSGAPDRLALGGALSLRRVNAAGTAQENGPPDYRHFCWSFNPKAVCDGTIDRLFLMTVGPEFPNGIKITRWNVSFDADPTTEADLDFKRADAFIGVANSAVVDVLDTTAGAASETTAANINSDTAVANGKVLYLEFGTAYTADNLQIIFEFWGYAV